MPEPTVLEKCPKCGFKSVYTRKGGGKRCMKCKWDSKDEPWGVTPPPKDVLDRPLLQDEETKP